MSYCMYVACMLYVCIMIMMIQLEVGLARPGARASAAAPGRGCTVIATVTRTRTYVTLIAVQVEHPTWFFLMLFKLRMQLDFVFKIFWSFDWNWNVKFVLHRTFQHHGQSHRLSGTPLAYPQADIPVYTCRYKQIQCLYMQIQFPNLSSTSLIIVQPICWTRGKCGLHETW